MDLSLPVMSGWDASRELKKDSTTKDIPIIAFTSHSTKSDREKAFEAGCDGFETKPIDFKELKVKILHWIHESK